MGRQITLVSETGSEPSFPDTNSTLTFSNTNMNNTSPIDVHQYETLIYAGSARKGSRNGKFLKSEFNQISHLCILPNGNLVVSDFGNNLLRLLNPKTRKVRNFCQKAKLLGPKGLCVFEDKVLVCDSNHHKIKAISMHGKESKLFAGSGKKGKIDGKMLQAQFVTPHSMCVTPDGNIAVSDIGNHSIRIIKPKENKVITLVTGTKEGGYRDGNVKEALFNNPTQMALDFDGGILVVDTGNNAIRKISSDYSNVFTIAGGSVRDVKCRDGAPSESAFNTPTGICLSSRGDIIVSDTQNNIIRVISDGSVKTFSGVQGKEGLKNGISFETKYSHPQGIVCVQTPENGDAFLIADSNNHTIRLIQSQEQGTVLEGNRNYASATDLGPLRLIVPSPEAIEQLSNGPLLSINERPASPTTPQYYAVAYKHETLLRNLFEKYHHSQSKPFISYLKFQRLVRDLYLLDKTKLDTHHCSLIFYEVSQDRRFINFDMFIRALCLLSRKKFGASANLKSTKLMLEDEETAESLSLFIEYLNQGQFLEDLPEEDYSETRPDMDNLAATLAMPKVYEIWAQYEDTLLKVFEHYAANAPLPTSTWQQTRLALRTISLEQFFKFARDFDMIPAFGSRHFITDTFLSSQQKLTGPTQDLESSALSQSLAGTAKSKSEELAKAVFDQSLDFYCFLECLGKLALHCYGNNPSMDAKYPNPEDKIFALIEHMCHCERGRERFGSTLRLKQSPTEALTSPKREALNRTYDQYRQERDQESIATKLKLAEGPYNTDRIDARRSRRTVSERILATAENVALYEYSHQKSFWKFVASGSLHLVSNPSYLVPLREPFLIKLHPVSPSESSVPIVSPLNSKNIPTVHEVDLFHIFAKGTFSNESKRTYALQFSVPEDSERFSTQYYKIQEYNPPQGPLGPTASTMNFNKSKLLKLNSLWAPENTINEDTRATTSSGTFNQSAPQTKSILKNSTKSNPGLSIKTKTHEPYNTLSSPIIKHTPRSPTRAKQQKSLQFNDEDLANVVSPQPMLDLPEPEPAVHDLSSDTLVVDERTAYDGSFDEDSFVATMKQLFLSYVEENISEEHQASQLKLLMDRIGWARELLSSNMSNYYSLASEDLVLKPKPEGTSEIRTKEEKLKLTLAEDPKSLVSALLEFEPSLMSPLKSVREYYNVLLNAMPTTSAALECKLTDQLGVTMFAVNERLCLVNDTQSTLHIRVLSNYLFTQSVLNVHVTVGGVTYEGEQLNPSFTASSLSVSFPFIVPKPDDQKKLSDDITFCMEKYQEVAGPIYETIVPVAIAISMESGDIYSCTALVSFATFSKAEGWDKIYVDLKEELSNDYSYLNDGFMPVALMTTRTTSEIHHVSSS